MPSKLFEALALLNDEQLIELESFFNWPSTELLESDRALATELLQAIKEGHDEDDCWEKALSEDQFKNKKRIANRLFKATEKYLTARVVPRDEVLDNILLSRFYGQKGLKKHANYCLKKAEEKNNHNNNIYFNHYLYKFKLEETIILSEIQYRRARLKYSLMLESLTDYYDIKSLQLLCADFYNFFFNDPKEDIQLNEIVARMHKIIDNTTAETAILYKYLLKIFKDFSDVKSYHKLKQLVTDPKFKLNLSEKSSWFYIISNFCVVQMNLGSADFAEDYINYKEQLEEMGTLLIDNHYPLSIFKNMVSAGIISGRYIWTMNFIQQKSKLIEESSELSREPFKQFNEAYTYLYIGDANKCLELMSNFRNSSMYRKDKFYKMAADKTMIKAHYQIGNIDAVYSNMEAVDKYIKRHKSLPILTKKTNSAFFDNLKKLMKGKKLCMDNTPILDIIWFKKITTAL